MMLRTCVVSACGPGGWSKDSHDPKSAAPPRDLVSLDSLCQSGFLVIVGIPKPRCPPGHQTPGPSHSNPGHTTANSLMGNIKHTVAETRPSLAKSIPSPHKKVPKRAPHGMAVLARVKRLTFNCPTLWMVSNRLRRHTSR